MKYVSVLAICLTFASPVYAIQLELDEGGVNYFVSGDSVCGAALNFMGKSVPGGLKSVERLPAPATRTFAVERGADLRIDIQGVFKLEAQRAASSRLQAVVYSADGVTEFGQAVKVAEAVGELSLSRVEAPRGLLTFLRKGTACVLASKKGQVVSVKGTCPVLRFQLGDAERIKVYHDGRYKARSRSATLTVEDVASVLDEAGDEGLRVLEDYLEQSGLKDADEMLAFIKMGRDAYARVAITKVVAKFTTEVSAATLVRILQVVPDEYKMIEAIKAVRERVKVSPKDLSTVVRLFSDGYKQTEAVGLLEVKGAQTGAAHMALTLSAIEDEYRKTDSLKNMMRSVEVVTADELRGILALFGDAHRQEAAVKLVAPKLSMVGADLPGLLGVIRDDLHRRLEVAKKLMPRLEMAGPEDVRASLATIRDPHVKLDLLKLLIKKVPAEERPALTPILESQFSGHILDDARKVAR